MTASRLEQYLAFLEKDPNSSFARYVIAQEYLKLGRTMEAVEAFRELIRRDPDYTAAYYHGGKALEQAGDAEGARALYTVGIAAAARTGNAHAGAELQEALATL